MTDAPEGPSSRRKLLKATAVMASGTLVSRILGFVRVMMIAFVLGNGTRQADIFSIAQTVPNSLFMLFAGGALNTVLVPQIVRAVKHDSDGGQKFISRIMTAFMLILAAITVVMTFLTPLIMTLYTNPGWRTPELADHWQSLLLLAYITMPQIFFYGVFFLVGQALNAREVFGPMMWAPVAPNIVSIAVFGLYLGIWGSAGMNAAAFTTEQTVFLGAGATLGIILQAVVLLPYLRRIGFKFQLRFDFRGSGLGHTFNLAKWTLAYVGVNQLALIVVDRMATAATVGGHGAGVTAYLNAYLVWILPHSLITISLATAMLPSASRLAAAGNLRGVGIETMRTMRLSSTFLLPAAIGFISLGLPFTQIAFGHGTGSDDASFVGWTLMAFSVGLVQFSLQYVCLRGFYALEDMRTPFFIQAVIATVNASLAALFVLPFDNPATVAPRLAIAFAIAYTVGWIISFAVLRRRLPGMAARELVRHLVRLLLASLPAGVLAWLTDWGITSLNDSLIVQIVALGVAIAVAVGTFLGMSRVLHIDEVQQAIAALRRRGRRHAPDTEEPGGEVGAVTGEPLPPSPLDDEGLAIFDSRSGDSPDAGDDDRHGDPVPVFIPAGTAAPAPDPTLPGAIQTYPEPFDGHEPTDEIDVAGQPVAQVEQDDVIGDRYRLDELLASRAQVLTWRAFDLTLSRPVLMHLLPPADDRTATILEAARHSAAATDARFLRVLDAAPSDTVTYGGYIVCEYVPGSSLRKVLADGPLSSLEAAWVVRELADALTWVHAQQQYHRRLNPDTVIITVTGNVKIVGFLLENVLDDVPSGEAGDEIDVRSLGELLYATLVSLWPGGARFGMPAAPSGRDGHPLSPRRVVPGIPAALDELCVRLLDPGSSDSGPASALSLMVALTKILGTADATSDLERRVKSPVRPLFQTSAMIGSSDSASAPSTTTDARRDGGEGGEGGHSDDEFGIPTVEIAAVSGDTGPLFTPVPPPLLPADDHDATPPRAPVTPSVTGRAGPRRRYWLVALSVLMVLVLLGSLAVVAITMSQRESHTAPQVTSPPASQQRTITRGFDFDPTADGGSGDENTDGVGLAFDGDESTAWRTEQYRGRPDLGGLKPGVGLVVDLGEVGDVSRVKVQVTGANSTVELKVPAQPTSGDTPPLNSRTQWRSIGTKSGVSGTTTFDLTNPQQTRYVLIYFTSLPTDGGGYRGGIAEIEVWS